MKSTSEIEKMRKEIDSLWDLSNAMRDPFMRLFAEINKASGATNCTENFSPEVYLDGAEKALTEIEQVILKYHRDIPQDYTENAKEV